MNRFTRQIVVAFRSDQNVDLLRSILEETWDDPCVAKWLADLATPIASFVKEIESELIGSDPIQFTTVQEQVHHYNARFIANQDDFIRDHLVGETPVAYSVSDGLPTSRLPNVSPQKTLESWNFNSGRGGTLRDDTSGASSHHHFARGGIVRRDCDSNNSASEPIDPRDEQRSDLHAHNQPVREEFSARPDGRKLGSSGAPMGAMRSTGITFCDQDGYGQSTHTALRETSMMRALNRGHLAHEETAFGTATDASDARLMSRRTFRKNEQGIENGIPVYEQRLYRRNYERDVDENLSSSEYGMKLHGHDMSSLYALVDHKNAVRAAYEPAPETRSHLRLWDAKAIPEEMRYGC